MPAQGGGTDCSGSCIPSPQGQWPQDWAAAGAATTCCPVCARDDHPYKRTGLWILCRSSLLPLGVVTLVFLFQLQQSAGTNHFLPAVQKIAAADGTDLERQSDTLEEGTWRNLSSLLCIKWIFKNLFLSVTGITPNKYVLAETFLPSECEMLSHKHLLKPHSDFSALSPQGKQMEV